MKPVMTMDGDTRPAQPSEFIVRRFGQDPGAYETTIFAGLMRDAGAGKTRLESTMKMYYGAADDGSPETVALIVPTWQRGTFGKKNIEDAAVPFASHRGTLLDATYAQLEWFDIQRGAIPSGIVGSVNPVTGVPAAVENLTVTPVGAGEVLLDWSPSAGATSYKLLLNGQTVFDRFNDTYRFFDNLSALNKYTFSVVPINAAGSGPETTLNFGAATVGVNLEDQTDAAPWATVGLDGSIWTRCLVWDEGEFTLNAHVQQLVNINGTWTAQVPIRVRGQIAECLTTGLDGAIWVASTGGGDFVQRLVKGQDGQWFVEGQAIAVDRGPTSLVTGIDGSIWVASYWDDSVQHIVQGQDGKWFVEGPAIPVDATPQSLAVGKDGSIWVASRKYDTVQRIVKDSNGKWGVQRFGDRPSIKVDESPYALAAGQDGSIWVASEKYGTVQRIVNENGTWFVKGQGISVDGRPRFLAAGVDGAMWVGCYDTLSLQRIVNERGAWFVQGNAIPHAQAPFTMPDGSIWAFANDNILRQFWTNPAAPTDLKVVPGPHEGMATLSWKAPAANGGTPVTSYTVTARQGATIKTETNWGDTEFRFSGLDVSKGPVYFTVAANNFVGASPVATLLMGQDGKPIDTTNLTTGITTDGTWVIGGGFDSVGNTYSWEALGSGAGVSNGKATFTFGLPNQPQVIVAAGQEIAVKQGAFGSVNLAGAAVYYGAQPNVAFTLNYTDGTTETWTQSISDWANPQRYNGETTLVTSPYRNQGDGTRDSRSVYLYGYSRAIPQGKTLKSITLPLNQNVRILDIKMGS